MKKPVRLYLLQVLHRVKPEKLFFLFYYLPESVVPASGSGTAF